MSWPATHHQLKTPFLQKEIGSALTAFLESNISRCSTNQPRDGVSVMILTTTNQPISDTILTTKARSTTSDLLIVTNPLCSSLNKNAARALQSSVYISIVQVEGDEKGDDRPYLHLSDPKTRTTPRVDWVLAVMHGRSARRRLLLTPYRLAPRLLPPETLPSTPNPALTPDQ